MTDDDTRRACRGQPRGQRPIAVAVRVEPGSARLRPRRWCPTWDQIGTARRAMASSTAPSRTARSRATA